MSTLPPGSHLGRFEIVAKLGEGGMGVVYKAKDTRLDRFVAIKVLPARLTGDPERHRRFVQEAKAASALNHPNIVTIYEIDRVDDVAFMAMELVSGKTLDQVIARQRLKLKDLLNYAGQAADALAKAHAAGIVHRDLKPSNIMVTDDGLVKVLDFGLAKLVVADVGTDQTTLAPLDPQVRTGEGFVVGTPAYMSPEQAEGKPVDGRSDIFSFGAVLYEMATGVRAFFGDSAASTLAAVLTATPPPPGQTSPDLPRELERIIVRCLRKEPARRFQVMADLVVELDEVKAESTERMAAVTGSKRRHGGRAITLAMAGVLVVLAIGAWAFWPREAPAGTPTLSTLTTFPGVERQPSLSPDGKQVAFAWNGEQQSNYDIYVKPVDAVAPLRLTTDPAVDGAPAWSPSGSQLAFVRAGGGGSAVYVTPPVPGSERKVTDLSVPFDPLVRVSWSPDGKWLATTDSGATPAENGIVLVSVDRGDRRMLVASPPAPARLSGPAISPTGDAIGYVTCVGTYSCDVWVLSFGPDLSPSGEPRRLTKQNAQISSLTWLPGGRTLVYAATTDMSVSSYLWRVDVSSAEPPVRLDFAGLRVVGASASLEGNRLVAAQGGSGYDIWKFSPPDPPNTQFLSSSASDVDPQFSPDGSKVAYASARSGRSQELWIANSDGTGLVPLTTGLPGRLHGAPRWSPDGRSIAYNAQGEDGTWDIHVMAASGGPSRRVTLHPLNENLPAWSEDGRWIYFGSLRTGQPEIWRVSAEGGEETQVTTKGGNQPFVDGATLYFRRGPVLVARSIATDEEREILTTLAGAQMPYVPRGADLWYLTQPNPVRRAYVEIRVRNLATGADRTFASFEGDSTITLTVSPDGKTALAGISRGQADLILVENFR